MIKYDLRFYCFLITIIILNFSLSPAQNNAPTITTDFPDTVITKQGISHKDSIFALQLTDFGFDSDGDSLFWSTSTQDSIITFFSTNQDTLYVHSQEIWFGRGVFTIKLADVFGDYEEKDIVVIAFKKDGTLLSDDGSKTEYYIPWHAQLDFNRISSVEQFIIDEGYSEEELDRKIHWSRWKKMKYLRDVVISGWQNEFTLDGWSWNSQKLYVNYILDGKCIIFS